MAKKTIQAQGTKWSVSFIDGAPVIEAESEGYWHSSRLTKKQAKTLAAALLEASTIGFSTGTKAAQSGGRHA